VCQRRVIERGTLQQWQMYYGGKWLQSGLSRHCPDKGEPLQLLIQYRWRIFSIACPPNSDPKPIPV
jgi:hypothetical protein